MKWHDKALTQTFGENWLNRGDWKFSKNLLYPEVKDQNEGNGATS